MRVAVTIELTAKERTKLEAIKNARSSPVRARERAAIVLLAADGLENNEIVRRLGQDKMKVGRWRLRYAKGGLEAILKDKTRPGRIPGLPAATKSHLIHLTVNEKPAGATQWSRTSMAKKVGVSPLSVGRVWAAAGLKPHRVKTFKLSNDQHFEEKLNDIVGLYLNPPEPAIVFSCDEQSQIQALDRTQPGLPLKQGRCQTLTHDDKRTGTNLARRRHEYGGWHDHWDLHGQAPSSGMDPLPQLDPQKRACRPRDPHHLRQLCDP